MKKTIDLRSLYVENDDWYMELLDSNVEGKPYSDDELRELFRNGVRKLEDEGDYDTLMYYQKLDSDEGVPSAVIIWKALNAIGIGYDSLTGRQLMHLREILEGELG